MVFRSKYVAKLGRFPLTKVLKCDDLTARIASAHLPLVANLLIRSVEVKPYANEQRFVSKGTVQSPSHSLSAASLSLLEI